MAALCGRVSVANDEGNLPQLRWPTGTYWRIYLAFVGLIFAVAVACFALGDASWGQAFVVISALGLLFYFVRAIRNG